MTRKIPEKAIEIIKHYEGCRLKPYRCPAGKMTIGYGHVIQPGEVFKEMTIDYAESLLEWDLQRFAKAVDEAVKVHVTDNQFGALVSFAYNIGIGAFKESTLLKKLNDEKYKEAVGQFLRWIYANTKELPGLVKRRVAERNLFLSGMEEK